MLLKCVVATSCIKPPVYALLQDGYMSGQQVHMLQECRARLLLALRNDAVALVDSWQHRCVALH
jgi:hypothetical protein